MDDLVELEGVLDRFQQVFGLYFLNRMALHSPDHHHAIDFFQLKSLLVVVVHHFTDLVQSRLPLLLQLRFVKQITDFDEPIGAHLDAFLGCAVSQNVAQKLGELDVVLFAAMTGCSFDAGNWLACSFDHD